MAGELGKASLDLEANLGPFERNVTAAGASSDKLRDKLEVLASIGDHAKSVLNDIGMSPGQGARSRVTAEEILSGVKHISEQSRDAAMELDRVHLSEAQAAESVAAGDLIDHKLDEIKDSAERTQRALDGVRLRLAAAGHGGGGHRPGYGVGPFGAGYGRLGVVGTGIALGVAAGPAAAPAALGLLAGIPTMAAAGAGALGTLALAFAGVGKAIGGDKKAFDDLTASQKQFVLLVRSLDGFLDRLKQIAGQSLFPGLTKGLKAALSPGTINALETALVQLGHAIGSAGAQWGKYFGSQRFQAIFGPLMASAARNIGVMSDAFLHLFDALGVLARAAIPFTNWIVSMIDKGARFADTWLRARDATGQLGGAMREAQSSLKLVGGLALALLRVVFALGKALYPLGKVAVKVLTDALNYLAGVLNRNRDIIQGVLIGALRGLIGVVKLAAEGVSILYHAVLGFVGKRGVIIAGIAAIGAAIAMSLGPQSAAIIGVLVAIALIKNNWGRIVTFFENLGRSIVYAFKYVWYLIEKGAIRAALKVVEPFSHLPGVLGGWARRAKNSMQGELDRLHAPNMNWAHYAGKAGYATGLAWMQGFDAAKQSKKLRDTPFTIKPLPFLFWLRQHPGGTRKQYDQYVALLKSAQEIDKQSQKNRAKHGNDPKPGTHAWYMKYLGYDPTQQPTFGPPPPFTKNTGSGSKAPTIPAAASHLIALASQQASIAATAKSLKKERAALDREITDLEKADTILLAKWRRAHGKTKTALFNEITVVQNRIRDARKKLRDAVSKAGASKLDYALAQAKVAVENAQEGSKAWDRAVTAEEKALKAEIAYWAKRAKNDRLSRDVRTAALKKELEYQKQLKALLAPIKAAASANIAQFLQTFAEIEQTFGYNAVPIQAPGQPTGGGKTNTHLHDLKNEARQTNRHLQAIRDQGRHPATTASRAAAMAVGA